MKTTLLAMLLALCAEANAPAETAELWLVNGGKFAATVVIPEDASYWTTLASQWLVEYVRKASGAELKVVGEAETKPAGKSLAAQANNYRKAVKVAPGGHSYYHAVPTEKYFEGHPEYFALIDGKRTGKGNHLCTSHPDVKQLLVKYMQMRYEQGLDWVSLRQEDGYLRCQCDECEKLDDYRFLDWQRDKADNRWETFQNTILNAQRMQCLPEWRLCRNGW